MSERGQDVAGFTGDRAITAAREETKYLLAADAASALVVELSKHLRAHRYSGEGANRLPDAQHYVTTIYFDTPGRLHFRQAVSDPEHNVKLRAKEYYDVHASLAELATDPAQIVRSQSSVWFELKRRNGTTSSKVRFHLKKCDVPSFFRGERPVSELALTHQPAHELEAILTYCREVGEPFVASSVVNYRRLSFQDERSTLRVTLDRELSFCAPIADMWLRPAAPVRSTCGKLCGRESRVVLEVKRRIDIPKWLGAAIATCGAEATVFSKFERAEQAVYGG